MSPCTRYTPSKGDRPFRTSSVSTKEAHQAVPALGAVESGSPPLVTVPHRKSTTRPEKPRLRGLADALRPSEDGKPMAFDSLQARKMVDLEYLLRYRNSKREDVFVGIDLLMYYTEGPFPQRVAPNVFVSFDVPSYPREIYRLAEEGKPPDWIIEVASPPKYRYDLGGKKDLYAELGVGEYFVYDPRGDMHDPRLRGWVLRSGAYVEMADLRRPGVPVALWSDALGLEFRFDGTDLRLWDPLVAGHLLTIAESQRRIDIAVAQRKAAEAEAERDAEAQARREAEARVAALEAELKRRRP